MNIKKLSALLVLISVFVFAAAMPAFAKSDPQLLPHAPQCQTSLVGAELVVECTDIGKDIVGASIIKYNHLPAYTVKMDEETLKMNVSLGSISQRLTFAWVVTDQQGNETIGYYPAKLSDN